MPKHRDSDEAVAYIYPRERGGVTRYYGDFRAFAAEGGKLEALKPAVDAPATTDHATAVLLAGARLKELRDLRKLNASSGPADRRFATFAAAHLKAKAINKEADMQWLESAERHLTIACTFFGPSTDIAVITARDMADFVEHLHGLSNRRSAHMKNGTINHYLNSLSNMFRRAISLGYIEIGKNPVATLFTRPANDATETLWLEVPEVAAILEFAKAWRSPRHDLAIPYLYEILAMFFYTGCRAAEIFGMCIGDIDFDREIIHVRVNDLRRVKTRTSARIIPLFPELAAILRAYLDGPFAPTGRLLFPAYNPGGPESMITDLRKSLDRMPMPARFERQRAPGEMTTAARKREKEIARWTKGVRGPKPAVSLEALRETPLAERIIPPLRFKMMRHTYCAARLQTLDGGKPIATFTVASELGHVDEKLVKKIYGHLGKNRYRSEHVEYLAAGAAFRAGTAQQMKRSA